MLAAVASLAISSILVRNSGIGAVASGGYRLLLAVPIILLFTVYFERKIPIPEQNKALKEHIYAVIAGVFFGLDLTLFNMSLRLTTMAEANLFTNLVPFLIAPISVVFFKQKIPLRFILPCILAFIALLLMNHGSIDQKHMHGNLLSLGSMVFYALYWVMIDLSGKKLGSYRMMTIASMTGGVTLFIVAYLMSEKMVPETIHGWIYLCGIALTGQVTGQLIITSSVRYISVELSTFLLLTQPLFAGLFAFFLFNEMLAPIQLIGGILLLFSIYLAKQILNRK